jgi:[acyl-carrier-protein] S-malonyltransferase
MISEGIAFLFPGQGSQYVGMGKSFCDSRPAVKRLFERASDLTGLNLARLCFEDPDSTLAQTDNVQPAITLVNIACLEAIREEGITPAAAAGHSLGEYAALYAAGALTFEDTMRLVRVRGAAMKAAADKHPGGMTAVLGIDMERAAAICDELQALGSLEIANQNSPGQVVFTGDLEPLRKLPETAKQKGAKLSIALKVSGAWHSRSMAEAQAPLSHALAAVDIGQPAFPVIANVSADDYPTEPEGVRSVLREQVVRPVLWADSIRRLIDQGHRTFVEVGPGKVLTGLLRDISREVKGFNIQDADTLAKFQEASAASR